MVSTKFSDKVFSISPSVYVAYHGLSAHYACGYFSSFRTGGVYETTIAYPSDGLSTYVGPLWMPVQTGPVPASLFQAINYTQFQEYEANTANAGYSKNLKIPSELVGIDPAWSTCTPGMYGAFDPPRALTAAHNMVAPTPAQKFIDHSATAAPASGIAPSNLPATPTPPPKDSANGPSKSDPSNASADPGSELKDPQTKENGDPASSVGQGDSDSNGGNAGGNPTPASEQGQGQDPDTAAQKESTQNTPPNHSSPEVSTQSMAAGESGGDNKSGAEAPGLNVDPQDSQDSPQTSEGTNGMPLTFTPVVLASPTPLVIGSGTIERAANGGVVIGKSTYTAGYEGQMSSVPFSVGVDKIVVGSTTLALPTSTPVFIGGKSMVKAANGGVVIGTSTYSAGSEAQISDTALSVGIYSVVVDGTSYALPTPGTADTNTANGIPISRASNGGALIEGNAVDLGSQISVNGHTISVGASTIVVDSTSYALATSAGAVLQYPPSQPKAPVTLTNGAVISPGGSAATVSGTTYTLPYDDSGLIVNGQTVPFPTETTLQSVFTVAGQTFTAATTGFSIGGQSVTLNGAAATLDGTAVSLGPSGVQIGSKTMPLTSAQATEGSLGGLIMSGFESGGGPGVTPAGGNESSIFAFTGEGSRAGKSMGIVYLGTMIMVMMFMVLWV